VAQRDIEELLHSPPTFYRRELPESSTDADDDDEDD
jgi:hypothetical protein